jgi:hypothetical protein
MESGCLRGLAIRRGDEPYVRRIQAEHFPADEFKAVGVTHGFRHIIDEFQVPADETPAGFRIAVARSRDHSLEFDLVRDIGYDRNGRLRPTPLIFSVDSVDPAEVAPWAQLIGNLTCNPGIVYDLFLNNPATNVDRRFKTIEEVLVELGHILGPGCDISVELHNPFEGDFGQILEEVKRYEEILSSHRLVVKVPHTGPVNAENVRELLTGDGRLGVRHDDARTADALRGHNLALRLRESGYRVNFTLMFEPYQTALALQSRPYFINAFHRHRQKATRTMRGLLAAYHASEDPDFVAQLRDYMVSADILAPSDSELDLLRVLHRARAMLHARGAADGPADGLDHARSALRWLNTANLPDTRLIICSMDGEEAYPAIVRMLEEPEFQPLQRRVVITTEPRYLARWTSSPQVVTYQRRFMAAARGVNEARRA